jgi:hypothetical protein
MENNPNAIRNIDLESIDSSVLVKGVSDFLCDSQSDKSLINHPNLASETEIVERKMSPIEPTIQNSELSSLLN